MTTPNSPSFLKIAPSDSVENPNEVSTPVRTNRVRDFPSADIAADETKEEDDAAQVAAVSTPLRAEANKAAKASADESETLTNAAVANNGGRNSEDINTAPSDRSINDDKTSQASLTEKTAPMLAKLSSWGKQANANAKDFWSKRRVTSTVFTETIKKSLPLTTASLEVPTPTSNRAGKPTFGSYMSGEERKEAAEAKESETQNAATSDPGVVSTNSKKEEPLMKTPPDSLASPGFPRSASSTQANNSNSALHTPIPFRTVETAPASMLSMGSLLSPQSARSGMSDDASSSYVSNYDDDTVSSYVSSTYTSDDGTVRGTLKWAAASVVDSMQTYRGRYNRSGSDMSDPAVPNVPNLHVRNNSLTNDSSLPPTSQTHRILQSRAKQHLQDLMEGLESNEYLMLLGHGMLGVNLKPTYLKYGGVFVDYLVHGGAAQKSGIIRPGDALCRIGDLDVRKGNILQVPNQIAQARRPVHLIFSTGLANKDRINYLDIATALLHTLVQRSDRRSVVRFEEPIIKEESDLPAGGESAEPTENASSTGSHEDDGSSSMELVKPTNFDKGEDEDETAEADPDKNVPDMVPSSTGFLRPAIPPPALRQAFVGIAAQRCNESFFRADRLWTSGGVSSDINLVRALKHAFTLTTADGRRLAFLVRQWSKEEEYQSQGGNGAKRRGGPAEHQFANTPNAMLMLYLELFQFMDLYGVTPASRRRSMAQKIANKFFLPVAIGTELVPPMLDFHHIVSDASLRKLESALKDENFDIPIDLFLDFQEAAMESLSGLHFLSFLVSDECSRMRAYMRNTAPYLNVPLDEVIRQVVEDRNSRTKNYLLYIIVYLITQADPEEVGETSEILDSKEDKRNRVDDAAASLCASIFIKRTLLKAIETINEKKNKETMKKLFESLEKFWELFLSPAVGSLESTALSAETRSKVNMLRAELEQICAPCRRTSRTYDDEASILAIELTAAQLTESQLVEELEYLSESLLYDYAVIGHSNFRGHKIHEWMCQEAVRSNSTDEEAEAVPFLAQNCIKRLLRKANMPQGVSSHKPFNSIGSDKKSHVKQDFQPQQCTAECAIVFGSADGMEYDSIPVIAAGQESGIRRYACQCLDQETMDVLTPDQIPPTLESYAVVPTNVYQQPFRGYHDCPLESVDGWEIALLSFKVPRVDSGSDENEDSSLYGVSLVCRRVASNDDVEENTIPTFFVKSPTNQNSILFEGSTDAGDLKRILHVHSDCTLFNSSFQVQNWRERHSTENAIIGIALVSRHNAIPSMRQALVNLLSRFNNDARACDFMCNSLVDVLGNFENNEVEGGVLRDFVQPHLEESLKPWLERPFGAQQAAFESDAGNQLIRSLPPIPLALLFITALLEQKIVITGSRRSILLSATTALSEMLKPLKWCHLLVPRVPASLAADLLQYPAPFILGMPAQDPGIFELIRELPDDITLVDLDVGRVILATSFAHDTELSRGTPKNEVTARALRTQVLSLAQCLGNVFGSRMDPASWLCDAFPDRDSTEMKPYDALKSVCRDFIDELLAGSTSCCYWVEEASGNDGESEKSKDPTVLFDEDRFFRIKGERRRTPFAPLLSPVSEGTKLALSAENFNLILEVFFRCQSMNAYIGSRDREEMVFAL
ncbi:hypothetical protein ACA910_008532 [Epithemia clementina (nom. ined.)]